MESERLSFSSIWKTTMPNDWTEGLKRVRALDVEAKASAFRDFVARECGAPLTVRGARSQLYLLTIAALAGRPRVIAIDDAQVILISAAEFEGILMDLELANFVKKLRTLPRRKIRNR